jgi:hypothetical protein
MDERGLTAAADGDILRLRTTVPLVVVARLERFIRRICGLPEGRYIITLTVTDEQAYWTVQELPKFEK